MLSQTARSVVRRLSVPQVTAVREKFAMSAAAERTSSGSNTSTIGGKLVPVELAYKTYEVKNGKPDKSPLVIHHSLLGSKKNWKKVAKEIHHVTKRTVVSVDARNHGDSPHARQMSYSHLAGDVRHLLGQMGMEKVSFMGQTMGGRVGMILALSQPHLFDKLICVDSTPRNTEASNVRWKTLREACAVLKALESQLRELSPVQRQRLADKALQNVLPDARDRSLFLMNLFMTKYTSTQQSGDAPPAPLWRLNIESFLCNPNMTASFPTFDEGVTFEGRALFVAGERSKFTNRDDEPLIRRHFPNAKFVWIPEGGHWVMNDKHEEFMAAVVPFLEAGKNSNSSSS